MIISKNKILNTVKLSILCAYLIKLILLYPHNSLFSQILIPSLMPTLDSLTSFPY
jgi:hypothetical protein